MNTGQTMLTFGALTLLSFVILNLNKNLGQSDISLAQNRYRLEALSIMSSYIEETSQYFFDEASTDTLTYKTLNDFTLPNQLGMEHNDYGVPDDFDDFNNYSVKDTGMSGVIYKLNFKVEYVQLVGSAMVISISRKYNKQMTISISDNYADPLIFRYKNGVKIKDTLQVSFVNSYWFYN